MDSYVSLLVKLHCYKDDSVFHLNGLFLRHSTLAIRSNTLAYLLLLNFNILEFMYEET